LLWLGRTRNYLICGQLKKPAGVNRRARERRPEPAPSWPHGAKQSGPKRACKIAPRRIPTPLGLSPWPLHLPAATVIFCRALGGSRASDVCQPIGAKARPANSICRKHSHEPFCPQCRPTLMGGFRQALRRLLLFASHYECANDQSVDITRGHCNLSDFGFCR
jgi:hypothetical protein